MNGTNLNRLRVVAAGLLCTVVAGTGFAQNSTEKWKDEPADEQAAEARAYPPAWSDPEFEKIADVLCGSWRTTRPVESEDGPEARLVMHMAPVYVDGVPDAMYLELARDDAMNQPYWQSILQFYRHKDGVRLRTYVIRNGNRMGPMVGMWLVPDLFPPLARENLIATLDIALGPSGDGYAGETPYPYPTGVDGAVEITSELEVAPGKLKTVDRGYGPDGQIVWGSDADSSYEYEQFDPDVTVERLDGGLVVIEYQKKRPDTPEVAHGATVAMNYTGWTAEGNEFDSSARRGRPMQYTYPGSFIDGWTRGTARVGTGSVRRLIIPGPIGYGPRGNPRAGIGPDATLYFDIECMGVVLQETIDAARGEAPDGDGGDGGGGE